MAENNFILDLIASLKGEQSQKQVKEDIKNFLSDIKLPLIGTLSPKTKAQLKQDIASLDATVNLSGKINSKDAASSLQQTIAQAQKQADAKPVEVGVDFNVKKDKLVNDIKLLAQQNSKLFKDTDMSIKYNSLLDDASMAKNTVQLSSLRNQLNAFKSELKVTGNMGLTFGDSLKKSLSKVMGLLGNFNVIMQFNQQLRNAWKEAKELDSAMTDLSRVNSEITRSGFPNYLDRVIDKTKQLAVATKDYIDSVTTFSRAGYNLTDSETLSDMSVQLMKVGDMSAVDASKALLAGLQGYIEIDGYGMDQLAEKAQALNDKIDIIGNTASLTQKEAAEGIQAVGSVMSDANTSVDEFLSLLGAGNRAVQDSNKVSLAIRTSALRIRGCTAELQEMGEETDSVIESTSTLAEKIKALTNINGSGGVNILEEDEETFRSIYDIYNDIAKVYDQISDKDASALLDLIAGKNRSNQVSAILQNMSEANELLERSLNATGTASEEFEIYLNSAEAATERFRVSVTETYSNIINGDMVKGLANASAAVLNYANSWGIVETTLKGGLIIGVMKGITNLTVALKNSAVQVSNYGVALEAVKQVGTYVEDTREYIDAVDNLRTSCSVLTDTQLKQVLAHKNLSDAQLIEILQLDKLEKAEQDARLAQLGLTQATEAQTAASMANLSITNMLRVAWTKFTAFATANPMAVGITAIVAATYAAMKASEAWTNRLKDQAQKSSNAYKDTLEEIESINSELQSNGQRIDELNAKENLTLVESEELEKLKESNRELENTLALKEKIAQQEKSEANKDAVKYFEEDTHTYNKETGAYNSTHIEVATQYLDEIYAKEQRIHELELEMSRTDDNTEKYRELSNELDITQKSYDDLLQRVQDYYDTFTDLDDNLFEGQDDALIQQLDAFYNYMNEVLYGIAETHTNTIRDILAKADFQDTSKELEELGKSGELSITTLSSCFPELIEYLKAAGISAQELYQYIMALSNPDAVNYAEIERRFMKSLGMGDRVDTAGEAQIWNEVRALGDEEIILDAYLRVCDQYGEHPEGWNAQDWISHIQSELEAEELEINVTFDQAWGDSFTHENDKVRELGDSLLGLAEKGRLTKEAFNEVDSTVGGYFKNLGVSADEAVSKINALVDESNQLSSMSSQISSMVDALSTKLEDGFVSADTLSGFDVEVRGLDSWDRFQEVLGSTTSSYEECQEAANALATEWVNDSNFLEQLTEQNEEYYKTQLKAMGIENYEELISYAHALNEAKEVLAQSSLELGNATYDEIEALIAEGQYSELTANMILALYDAKIAEQAATIDTAQDCQNLIDLAGDADRTSRSIQLLIQLMNIYSGLEDGVYAKNDFARTTALGMATAIKAQLEALANGEVKNMEIEPTVKLGSKGKSSITHFNYATF